MSVGDIIGVVTILVQVGQDLYDRVDAIDEAHEDLMLLTIHLQVLSNVFKGSENDVLLAYSSEFTRMLGILKSIQESYNKFAKVLGVESAGTPSGSQKTATNGRSFGRRVMVFARIPGILAEIRYKAEQLQKITSILSVSFLSDVRRHQRDSNEKDSLSSSVVKAAPAPNDALGLGLSTGFASIDRMVENLLKECKYLQDQLKETTLFPDASAVQDYQAQNPEGAAFWRDRFQKGKLNASALRYETLYVSWARFVHETETSFILNTIPTGVFETGDIDEIRLKGSRYSIDQSGKRSLSMIWPLWLPALRSALDPLQKGYVKPDDYFKLIRNCSLSDTLRRLVLESAGYGMIVECERASADISLPAAIESPGHVGWISAQIVAVPTPAELGIVAARDGVEASSNPISAYMNGTADDVHVYVRYLQTGQIEHKSLSKQVRPAGGLAIGAAVSICHELDSGDHAWSGDLQITEFKACQGGEYIVTARNSSPSVEFRTRPLKSLSGVILHGNDTSVSSGLPNFDYMLLGPSKVFIYAPKVGEKIQIEYDGFWYDSRVTVVDGDEIEFVDWESTPEQDETIAIQAVEGDQVDDEDDGNFFFSEEQLTELGKGTRRLWRPWLRDIKRYDVRPYRRFHIGDTVEAPVMYPDFRYHFHVMDDSQLYLPARIVDVQGDQYVIDFSPEFSVHRWWPGRVPYGEEIELVPGSGMKIENPFDFVRVTVAMDRVRPYIAGPRPVLGMQSAKPTGWSAFQGIHLCGLEDLLERSLWNNDRDDEQVGSQRTERIPL